MKENINEGSNVFNAKKRHYLKKLICFIVLSVILCINSLGSTQVIVQAATTPLEYFKKTEKENLNKQIDALSKNYASYISNYQEALKTNIGFETTLQANIDSSITDGTYFEGIKSIKASSISMSKGTESKSDMVISLNDNELTSLAAYTTLNDLFYLMIPSLSDAYLKIDTNNMQGDVTSNAIQNSLEEYLKDPLTEKELNKLLKKYGAIIIDNVDNVTTKKNVNVTIDNIKSKYTRLTVTINEMDALDITKALLTEAKKDTSLKNLVVELGLIEKSKYNNTINEYLTNISKEQKALKKKKTNGENVLKMYLWVDSKGEIAGRSFTIGSGDEAVKFGYNTTKSGLKMGVDAWYNSNGQDILRLTGNLNAKITGASGDFDLTYFDTTLETSTALTIKIKDFKYEKSNNKSFINGNFDITSKAFSGISLNMKFSGELGKQDMLLNVLDNSKTIASISATVKEVPFVDFELPSSTDKIYDFNNQLNDYLEGADIKGFLEGIKEKSDVYIIDSYIDLILADMEAY